MAFALIALGSNLFDRSALIDRAIEHIARLPTTALLYAARTIETDPVDCPPDARPFLNTACAISTALDPLELLDELLRIERILGRHRDGTRNASRPIDLDLLLYDDRVMTHPRLILPHPRLHERRFVLEPLTQIAAQAMHPTIGQTIATLLERLGR